MNTLPTNLQTKLDRELDEGETINWSARPNYRILRNETIKAWRVLFFLAALLAGVFTLLGVLAYFDLMDDDTPIGYAIAVVVTLVLGVLLLWPMLNSAKYTSNNTIYAITSKRAIIITLNRNKSITERDYRADELIHLARIEFPDGSGSLTLESARGAGSTSQVNYRHQLRAIENVIEVERLLRKQFGDA